MQNLNEFYTELVQPEDELDIYETEMSATQAVTEYEDIETSDLVSSLLLSRNPETVTEDVITAQLDPKGESIDFRQTELEGKGWEFTPATEGQNRKITYVGKSEEFQGLGKYMSAEEFLQQNPEGFKKVNPHLWARMQKEEQMRREAPTRLATAINTEIQTKIEAIQKETDPLKKQLMMGELKASVTESAANLTKEMRVSAEMQAGIPKLTALIQKHERMDRADPNWALQDSPTTRHLKMQLRQAEKGVGSLTKQMISENPTIKGMSERLKGFFVMQEYEMKADLRRTEKAEAKQEAMDERIEATAGLLTSSSVDYLSKVYPQVQGNKETAAKLVMDMSKNADLRKVWEPLLNPAFEEGDLIPLSLSGNSIAQQILVKTQMERTGQNMDEVRSEFGRVLRLVGDENAFMEVLSRQNKTKATKELIFNYKRMQTEKGKESQAMRAQVRMSFAMDQLNAYKTNEMMGNVEAWNGDLTLRNNPEIAKTIDLIKTTNGGKPVALQSLVEKYVLMAPKTERLARSQEIERAMMSSLKKYEKSLFGKADIITMKNALNAEVGTTQMIARGLDEYLKAGEKLGVEGFPNIMGGVHPSVFQSQGAR